MPLRNSSAENPVRQLRKTPPFKLASPTEAQALITVVQSTIALSPSSNFHPRRVLAIINPASGRGVAPTVYSRHVKPILEAAGMILTEATTTSRGHATEIIKKILPTEFDLILSLGGDGTMFEVLQGVLQRPDWVDMSQIPLLQIPCGSGNALAASTGLRDVPTAAHAAVKGQKQLLDIASVVQQQQPQQLESSRSPLRDGNTNSRLEAETLEDSLEQGQGREVESPVRFFSFLSCTYGMLSNLDIGTEHLRCLGSTRFIVGAIQQIIMQHTFKLKVAYLDADQINHSGGSNDNTSSVQGVQAVVGNNEMLSRGEDGVRHGWQSVTENVGYGPSLHYLTEFSPIIATSLGEKNSTSTSTSATTTATTAASVSASTSPSSRPLLPPGWNWLPADKIQLFAACNLPQLDMNFQFAPQAKLNSGHFNLLYTSGRSGWLKGLALLTAAETGEHMHLVHECKVKAFWIEPLAKSGATWLVCDGEEVPMRPLYAEVHPGLVTTLRAPDIIGR